MLVVVTPQGEARWRARTPDFLSMIIENTRPGQIEV